MNTTRVAIVVGKDADVDAELAVLIREQHIWVVDTPRNRVAAERIWTKAQGDSKNPLTTFSVDESMSPDTSVGDVLPVIDEHHGLGPESPREVRLGLRRRPHATNRRGPSRLRPFECEERKSSFVARRARVV